MKNPYIGFKVKLTSSQLGQVVGTVCNVTESKIELSKAVLNNTGTRFDLFSVESQYIQDIRILATSKGGEGGCDGLSDDVPTPTGIREKNTIAGRAERRELLRKLPNTCNAYVCPESPPLVHSTSGAHNVPDGRGETIPRQPNRCLLQTLDSALASVKIVDKQPNYRSKKLRPTEKVGGKGQNFPMSEAMMSSEMSGTESDSMGLSAHPSTYRAMIMPGQLTGGNVSSRQPWSRLRGHLGNQRAGGNKQNLQQQQQVPGNIGWDHVRVEDFIDQDFDFEKNLALFDKNAFYEMVDMKKQGGNPVVTQNSSTTTALGVPPSSATFDEGPDGVGVPLMGDVPHSVRANNRCKVVSDYTGNSTITTNTPTQSSSRKPHQHHIPGQPESTREQSDRTDANYSDSRSVPDTRLASLSTSHGVCATVPYLKEKPLPQDWYSPAGQRIPLLTTEDRDRLLAYLATGLDPLQYSPSRGKPVGLTWGRLLEASARSLTDHLMQPHANQSLKQTPQQRPSQALPIRVLIVPGGAHVGGSLSLTLARLLANRGACVLVLAPGQLTAPSDVSAGTSISMQDVYRTEMDLLLRMAPRLNQYGLEDDEMEDAGRFVGASGDDLDDDYDEEGVDEGEQGTGGEGEVSEQVGNSGARFDETGGAKNELVRNGVAVGDELDELDALLSDSWHASDHSADRSDSDMASGLTLCQASGTGIKPAVVEYSPANRMWISRMPGLKVLRRFSSLARLSTDVCVDLMIVTGESVTTAVDVRHHLINWFARHKAISRLVCLLPTSGCADGLLPNRSECATSVVELGLPTISPSEVLTRSSPAITSRWLVDVGLTRSHVRRLTGDLKSLPPYGLFSAGSVVQLHWNRPLVGQSPTPQTRAN